MSPLNKPFKGGILKRLSHFYELKIDNKDIIILTKSYNGSPIFFHFYDVLIGPKEIIERFSKELFPKQNLDKGWLPVVRYID